MDSNSEPEKLRRCSLVITPWLWRSASCHGRASQGSKQSHSRNSSCDVSVSDASRNSDRDRTPEHKEMKIKFAFES